MTLKFIPFVNTIDELANSNEIPFVTLKYTSVESTLTVIINRIKFAFYNLCDRLVF